MISCAYGQERQDNARFRSLPPRCPGVPGTPAIEQSALKLRAQCALERSPMSKSVIIEIRAAEGGTDAKLLVELQAGIYARFATKHCL